MKAFEFQTQVSPQGMVLIPDEVLAQMNEERSVRVILLVPEPPEGNDWSVLTADQFLKGYAECDAVYDQLHEG